ncbi:putative kinase [Paenibacillus amylolyticus]|uniref:Kinase n=1 Tax=Paenibacillus amylolyticus TaxID=1451 RepID=A0AAP5LLP3_PAEAM|nr:ATP-binding protein [Paenibacillus amylolyticus]MDR6723291.1 putative kinase [Paenibacillus amylolyticus]
MECIIFVGIQASGKSTFYQTNFFKTHMRINLDMLRTRHREQIYLTASLEAKQPFVIDNTNPTIEERKKYIDAAKRNRFKIVGYYFEPDYELFFARNELREGTAKIPEVGLKSTLKNLQMPTYAEGFDTLYVIRSVDGEFEVEQI